MSETGLLPCPFCGAFAGYYVSGNKGYVYCAGCGVSTDGSYTHREPDWAEEETRLWNTRVYPKEVKKAVERDKPKKPDNVMKKDGLLIGLCKACGTPIDNGHRFCRICGQKLDWSHYA